jgi:hypothetical protein
MKKKTKTKKTKPRASRNKKPRRSQKPPKVVIVAEMPERPEPGKEYDLLEQGLPHRRIVEFPQMKGRTIKAIRFYTSADENTIAIRFHDRTQLSLRIEPALVLNADLLKISKWDCDTIKEWPPIHSELRNPEA